MENKIVKCPGCGSEDIMSGSLSASFGLVFIPDGEKKLLKKSSYVNCKACKDCGSVFALSLSDTPNKLTN